MAWLAKQIWFEVDLIFINKLIYKNGEKTKSDIH